MARNKWALKIAELVADIECNPDNGAALYNAFNELKYWRIEALEPAERKVYNYIAELGRPVVSWNISEDFGIKLNHASGILKALTSYGLLDRQEEINENGRQFIYTLHRSL